MKLKGKFKHGTVSMTSRQIKKHYQDMSEEEVEHIVDSVLDIPVQDWHFSGHLIRKLRKDGLFFDPFIVEETIMELDERNIIEYNLTRMNNYEDRRVLVRSTKSYPVDIKGEWKWCNLCFVVSIDRGTLVTAYWNEEHDNHWNVDYSRYSKELAIL